MNLNDVYEKTSLLMIVILKSKTRFAILLKSVKNYFFCFYYNFNSYNEILLVDDLWIVWLNDFLNIRPVKIMFVLANLLFYLSFRCFFNVNWVVLFFYKHYRHHHITNKLTQTRSKIQKRKAKDSQFEILKMERVSVGRTARRAAKILSTRHVATRMEGAFGFCHPVQCDLIHIYFYVKQFRYCYTDLFLF